MQAHQVELRLEVVAEADDARPALALPVVGDAPQLVGREPAVRELRGQVVVEGRRQRELEFAVEEALFAGGEGDGQLAGGRAGFGVRVAGFALRAVVVVGFDLERVGGLVFGFWKGVEPGGGCAALTISFAFLTKLPRKPPPRVGEVVVSGLEVFSSQPPSPIIVLDAFLTVKAPWGRNGAKGV